MIASKKNTVCIKNRRDLKEVREGVASKKYLGNLSVSIEDVFKLLLLHEKLINGINGGWKWLPQEK